MWVWLEWDHIFLPQVGGSLVVLWTYSRTRERTDRQAKGCPRHPCFFYLHYFLYWNPSLKLWVSVFWLCAWIGTHSEHTTVWICTWCHRVGILGFTPEPRWLFSSISCVARRPSGPSCIRCLSWVHANSPFWECMFSDKDYDKYHSASLTVWATKPSLLHLGKERVINKAPTVHSFAIWNPLSENGIFPGQLINVHLPHLLVSISPSASIKLQMNGRAPLHTLIMVIMACWLH